MKKILSWMGATTVAATVALASTVPSTGAPTLLPRPEIAQPLDVIHVRDGTRWRGSGFRGSGWRNGGNWRGGHWRGNGFRGGGYHGGYRGGYYGGYNGYGGYYGDDFWIAGGALMLGALIGSAIANNNYYGGYSYGDRYLYPEGYVNYGERYRPYRYSNRPYRYSHTPYRNQTVDPYLGWQRALDR